MQYRWTSQQGHPIATSESYILTSTKRSRESVKTFVPPHHPRFSDSVFINCPFDVEYWPIFEAIVFCVLDCGFVPHCALEEADSGTFRLNKIQEIICRSEYTTHDLSRVELNIGTRLPRFNMPFELGLDIDCRMYDSGQARRKKCLMLEWRRGFVQIKNPPQKFLSYRRASHSLLNK